MHKGVSALAAASIIALAGCSGAAQSPGAAASPQSVAPAVHTSTPSPSAAPTPSAPAKATWGQAVKLPSGISLTVTLEGVKPAQDLAYGVHYGRTAAFRATMHNGTSGPLNLAQIGTEAPTVMAGPDGTQVQPSTWDGYSYPSFPALQPGESFTWEWGVADAAGLKDALVQYQLALPMYQGGPSVMEWEGNVP